MYYPHYAQEMTIFSSEKFKNLFQIAKLKSGGMVVGSEVVLVSHTEYYGSNLNHSETFQWVSIQQALI